MLEKLNLKNLLGAGLRFKATAFITVVVIIVAAVLSGYFITHQRNQAYQELQRRGVSLTKNLAYNSEYGVLISSEDELNNFINALAEEDDFVYVIIQDEEGDIIASTKTGLEENVLSKVREQEEPTEVIEDAVIHTLGTDRWGSVFDIAYPIVTRSRETDILGFEIDTGPEDVRVIGSARVGITLRDVEQMVMRNSVNIILITVLIIIIAGFLTSFSVGKLFMETLNQLVLAAEAIGRGELKGTLKLKASKDEFGQLAVAFKNMQSQLSIMAEQAQALADDDLQNEILNEKVQGDLGDAFFTMVNNLRGFAEIAELISKDNIYHDHINRFIEQNADSTGSKRGILTVSFLNMLTMIKKTVSQAEIIANDDLYNEKLTTEDKGNLGGAFSEMVRKLRNLAKQAEYIAEGDLRNKALSEKGTGTLSAAFASMVVSLRKLSEQADAIAEGNLRAPILREKIQGDLGNAFNKMADNLRKLIGSVQEVALHVSKSANETLESSRKLLTGAKKQTEKAEESSTAVMEMTSSIQEVSTNAVNAEKKSNQASQASSKGVKVVKDTVESLSEITSNVDEVASRMSELEKGSREIGKIVNAISEISEQTNLLALNATIEAARTGEAGKGFAVVADEVKKLAERSASSAKEIASIIKNIQEDMNITMDAMGKNKESTAKAVSVSSSLDETFKSIQDIIKDTKLSIDEITTAMREQETASANIEVSVNSIKEVIQESEAASEKMTSQAQKVNQITKDLQAMLQKFNV